MNSKCLYQAPELLRLCQFKGHNTNLYVELKNTAISCLEILFSDLLMLFLSYVIRGSSGPCACLWKHHRFCALHQPQYPDHADSAHAKCPAEPDHCIRPAHTAAELTPHRAYESGACLCYHDDGGYTQHFPDRETIHIYSCVWNR